MGKTRTRTRGFRVSGLQQDREEDEFAKLDAHRPFSFHEMKSDLVLPNGARFYNDHTHPEYPHRNAERRAIWSPAIALDSAFLQSAAARRNRALGGPYVQIYKNNTDFRGTATAVTTIVPSPVRFRSPRWLRRFCLLSAAKSLQGRKDGDRDPRGCSRRARFNSLSARISWRRF